MGGTANKKCTAEAKVACKAKKDAEQATHPPPTSIDPIGSKPPDSSGSKYPKKSRAVPQEKMTHAPPSISTRHSTHSHSTSVTVSSGSGQQHTQAGLDAGSITTCPRHLATAAAEVLLQQVGLSEDTNSEEDLNGDSSSEDTEFDGDEDGGVVGSDDEGSSDRIEVVEGGVELSLDTLTTQQGLVRASAASYCAQKTAQKVQVIEEEEEEEEEESDEEFGESLC
jgi:hypothetical protein